MTEIKFRIEERLVISIPLSEAAQLGLHLAVFGPDGEMPRSRRMAEKIAVAIDLAGQGEPTELRLSRLHREVIAGGVAAMLDARGGNVSEQLVRLRDACLVDERA